MFWKIQLLELLNFSVDAWLITTPPKKKHLATCQTNWGVVNKLLTLLNEFVSNIQLFNPKIFCSQGQGKRVPPKRSSIRKWWVLWARSSQRCFCIISLGSRVASQPTRSAILKRDSFLVRGDQFQRANKQLFDKLFLCYWIFWAFLVDISSCHDADAMPDL